MTIQRDSSFRLYHSLSDTPGDTPAPSANQQAPATEAYISEVAALQQQLDALRAAHEKELAQLRAETNLQLTMLRAALADAATKAITTDTAAPVAAQNPQDARPEPLEMAGAPATVESRESRESRESIELPAPTRDDQQEHPASADGAGSSRRTLLKWGGLGAAAALAAAGGATFSMPTAHASNGGPLLLGQSNSAENTTVLNYDGSESNPLAFRAMISAPNSTAVSGTAGSGSSSFGVYGTAGTDGNGVIGLANGASSYGVLGTTDSGYAVVGTSTSGIDLAALGSGRLWQQTASFTGAPTSGTYAVGEQIRDSAGNLFICISGGTPGVWKQVLTQDTSFNGGMIVFLATPIRVYDSRVSNSPLVGNAPYNPQVTGVNIGGVQVPNGAIGCIGNLTVYHPTASGYLVIYPAGSPTPSTSTVNFVAGQTIPNSFAVGLSAGGVVTVYAFQGGSCHFIVDITGFVS